MQGITRVGGGAPGRLQSLWLPLQGSLCLPTTPVRTPGELKEALSAITPNNTLLVIEVAADNNDLVLDEPIEISINASDWQVTIAAAPAEKGGDVTFRCRDAETALIIR